MRQMSFNRAASPPRGPSAAVGDEELPAHKGRSTAFSSRHSRRVESIQREVARSRNDHHEDSLQQRQSPQDQKQENLHQPRTGPEASHQANSYRPNNLYQQTSTTTTSQASTARPPAFQDAWDQPPPSQGLTQPPMYNMSELKHLEQRCWRRG